MSDSLEVTRPFTRDVFRGMAEPIRHADDGPFFKALDSVLTADGKPDAQDAADAWKRGPSRTSLRPSLVLQRTSAPGTKSYSQAATCCWKRYFQSSSPPLSWL